MKVGDLVFNKRIPAKILGIVVRLYSIVNKIMHKKPVPMAVVATGDGTYHWKRRKLGVFDEDR